MLSFTPYTEMNRDTNEIENLKFSIAIFQCISISIFFSILYYMLLRFLKACNLIKWNKLISSFATHKSYSKTFEKYQHSFYTLSK